MQRPSWIVRLLGHWRPVTLERSGSAFNPVLQINYHKGRYMLDAATVNYSHGALHEVMEKALLHYAVVYGGEPQHVLILGHGGGSAGQLVRQLFPEAHITAVEHDPEVIRLSARYFDTAADELICADAFSWLSENGALYDLIITDLFSEAAVPAQALVVSFYTAALNRLQQGGVMIQNHMYTDEGWRPVWRRFEDFWSEATLYRMFDSNYLMFGRKPDGGE